MFRNRKPDERKPHPDPATELQLQLIGSLVRRMRLAERQIRLYQDELEDAHRDNGGLITNVRNYHAVRDRIDEIRDFLRDRVTAAEHSIRDQHELAASLREQAQAAVGKAQLSADDMAYLDLGDSDA